MSRRRPFVVAAALALGLVLAESGVRIFTLVVPQLGNDLARWDPLNVIYEPHGEFGYRQIPRRFQLHKNGVISTANAMGFRGPEVAWQKPPGTFRIVLSGGSTTFGWDVADDETIDSYMRQSLRLRFPRRSFEVINLALGGYDSYQVFERIRSDGVRLNPDVLILNKGVNDVRNAPYSQLVDADPRTLIWEHAMREMRAERAAGRPKLWNVAKHWSYLARLPGFARSRFGGLSAAKRRAKTPIYPDAVDYFERNIRRTLALMPKRTHVLLSTPPSALRLSFEPHDTSSLPYWIVDAETTQRYRDLLADRLQAIARERAAAGWSVRYVRPLADREAFSDDCHLTPSGNRAVADQFLAAIADWLGASEGAAPE